LYQEKSGNPVAVHRYLVAIKDLQNSASAKFGRLLPAKLTERQRRLEKVAEQQADQMGF
jgi:hypothetical protein